MNSEARFPAGESNCFEPASPAPAVALRTGLCGSAAESPAARCCAASCSFCCRPTETLSCPSLGEDGGECELPEPAEPRVD